MKRNLKSIFIFGYSILSVAIVLNVLARAFNIKSWYDFLNSPNDTSILSYIWLFIMYPFTLGLVPYVISKLVKINK